MAALLPGLGLFGTVLTARRKKWFTRKSIGWMSVLGLLLFVSLFALGCGGSKSTSSTTTPATAQATLMVTGTSGSLSHTSAVTVTVK